MLFVMKKCKYCNENIPDYSVICPICAETLIDNTKQCPYCKEQIPTESKVCPVCDETLIIESSPVTNITKKESSPKCLVVKPQKINKQKAKFKADSTQLKPERSSVPKKWINKVAIAIVLVVIAVPAFLYGYKLELFNFEFNTESNSVKTLEDIDAIVKSINSRGDIVIAQNDSINAIFYLTKFYKDDYKPNVLARYDLLTDSVSKKIQFSCYNDNDAPYFVFDDYVVSGDDLIIIGNPCNNGTPWFSVIKYNLTSGQTSYIIDSMEGSAKFNTDKSALEIEEYVLVYQGTCTATNKYSSRQCVYDFNGTLLSSDTTDYDDIKARLYAYYSEKIELEDLLTAELNEINKYGMINDAMCGLGEGASQVRLFPEVGTDGTVELEVDEIRISGFETVSSNVRRVELEYKHSYEHKHSYFISIDFKKEGGKWKIYDVLDENRRSYRKSNSDFSKYIIDARIKNIPVSFIFPNLYPGPINYAEGSPIVCSVVYNNVKTSNYLFVIQDGNGGLLEYEYDSPGSGRLTGTFRTTGNDLVYVRQKDKAEFPVKFKSASDLNKFLNFCKI